MHHPPKRPSEHDQSQRRYPRPRFRRPNPTRRLLVRPLFSPHITHLNPISSHLTNPPFRADIVVAILLRQKPSLHPTILTPSIGEPEANTITNYTSGTLNTRLRALTHSTPLTKRLIYIWLRLRSLSSFLLAHAHDIDAYYFSDKCDSIERQILALLHSDRLSSSSSSSSVAFTTAFLNASLIYATEELRECPKYTNICIALSARIYSGLQMADFDALAAQCPELLLFVLMLGRSGNAPVGVQEGEASRVWYEKTIGDVGRGFGVKVPATLAGWGYFEVAERTLGDELDVEVGVGSGSEDEDEGEEGGDK